jgi:hypothetical protein
MRTASGTVAAPGGKPSPWLRDVPWLGDVTVSGACAIASGVLFLSKSILERSIGEPPAAESELAGWTSANALSLAWLNELLLFSTVLLIPVVQALYRTLRGARRPWAAFGCGILAATIPVLLILGMVQGRLVYPVYDISVAHPSSVALVTSLYHGGAHEAALLLASALIMLGLVMARSAYGQLVAVVGVIAGLAQVAASFPWIIGPDLTFLSQTLLAAWLLLVGVRLLQGRRSGTIPDSVVA